MRPAFDFLDVSNNFTNPDGTIDFDEIFLPDEVIENGVPSFFYPTFGNESDAFRLSGNKKIKLSTNPSSAAIQTYNFNGHNPSANYDNSVIMLNALSIEILEENVNPTLYGTGARKIKIRWDDFDVDENPRWCGSIILSPTWKPITLPLDNASEYSLNIKTTHSITLDRGLSPTQHVAFEGDGSTNNPYLFTQPTVMHCEANSYFHIEPDADLYIRNGSTLEMLGGSKLELASGARVHVESGCTLKIANDAELKIFQGGLVEVEAGGTLIIENTTAGKGIQFGGGNPNAEVRISGSLIYSNGADMEHYGNGFYHLSGTPTLTLNTGSIVNLVGNNINEKMLEIDAQVTIDGPAVTFSTGKIVVRDNGWLKIKNALCRFPM